MKKIKKISLISALAVGAVATIGTTVGVVVNSINNQNNATSQNVYSATIQSENISMTRSSNYAKGEWHRITSKNPDVVRLAGWQTSHEMQTGWYVPVRAFIKNDWTMALLNIGKDANGNKLVSIGQYGNFPFDVNTFWTIFDNITITSWIVK